LQEKRRLKAEVESEREIDNELNPEWNDLSGIVEQW
jgi:hypothetical protein